MQFKRLLAQLNESVQDYPKELDDRLAGVLVNTMTPKPHQRASIAFIQQARICLQACSTLSVRLAGLSCLHRC